MKLDRWIHQLKFSNEQSFKSPELIKLSIATQFFPPDYAATGQLIEELVQQLSLQGVDIEIFTSQPGYAFHTHTAPKIEVSPQVRIQRSRTAQLFPGRIRGKAINGILYTLRVLLYLFKAWRRRSLLLLTTAPPFLPIIGYLAYILFRMPYVCILYDLYPDIAIALGVISPHHWLVKFWQMLNRRIWLNAKGIIVLSPGMKQQVLATCPQIAAKICVIHSWGNPDLIVPIPKQENWFAWRYNLVHKFTVLYSGNMGRCHDINTILIAAKELQDKPIQFVCIGGGAKRDDLIAKVNCLGLKNFIFLPYQDKDVLPYSLTACDLSLVSLDKTTENLVVPSKLYSALATGRPIAAICSRYSYLRQIIAEAECGSYFDNGDGYGLAQFIQLLSSDSELCEHMGRAGREYLRTHFTPKIISQKYLEVLENIVLNNRTQLVSL